MRHCEKNLSDNSLAHRQEHNKNTSQPYTPHHYLSDLLSLLKKDCSPAALINREKKLINAQLKQCKKYSPQYIFTNKNKLEYVQKDAQFSNELLNSKSDTLPNINVLQQMDCQDVQLYLQKLNIDLEPLYYLNKEMQLPDNFISNYVEQFTQHEISLLLTNWQDLTECSDKATDFNGNKRHKYKSHKLFIAKSYGIDDVTQFMTCMNNKEVISKEKKNSLYLTHINIDKFLHITGICRAELDTILTQNLNNQIELGGTQQVEFQSLFFCNYNVDGYALINKGATEITWQTINENEEEGLLYWLFQVQRMLTLSKLTGFTASELDLILATCSTLILDVKALTYISLVQNIQKALKLSVEDICALVRAMNMMGIGNNNAPENLFDKIYNSTAAITDNYYIGYYFQSPTHFINQGRSALRLQGNILTDENRLYRQRVASCLNIKESQLISIVKHFRIKLNDETLWSKAQHEISMLNSFYKIILLSKITSLSLVELLNVFDFLSENIALIPHLNKQPGEIFTGFELNSNEKNSYQVIIRQDNENVENSFVLIQHCLFISHWLQQHSCSVVNLPKKFAESVENKSYVVSTSSLSNKLQESRLYRELKWQQWLAKNARIAMFFRWLQRRNAYNTPFIYGKQPFRSQLTYVKG